MSHAWLDFFAFKNLSSEEGALPHLSPHKDFILWVLTQ